MGHRASALCAAPNRKELGAGSWTNPQPIWNAFKPGLAPPKGKEGGIHKNSGRYSSSLDIIEHPNEVRQLTFTRVRYVTREIL